MVRLVGVFRRRACMANPSLVSVLAKAFLAGEPTVAEVVARAERTLGRSWPWLRPLAERYVESFRGQTRPRHRDVVRLIQEDAGVQRARAKHANELTLSEWLAEPQRMLPVPAAQAWDLPSIESAGALADWFWLEPGELEWFADLKGLGTKSRSATLRHYHYIVLTKRFGAIRLIEAPKPRLKKLQRQILEWILEKIPVHPCAHGFIKGRSIKTFVAPHVAKRVVLRMDLRDFFPTLRAARIQTLFRTLGYPESVADLLGGLCTTATPRDVWNRPEVEPDRAQLWETRSLYSRTHVPQGAPTSPALANLCAYRVDCRLAGLAQSAGAVYTRYADDLAFSGDADFERRVDRFATHVAAILEEEGFAVQHRKTRVMRQSVRQHLAGVVANQHLNIRRSDFDLLKAILTNCVRLGPESQNRDGHSDFRSHLEGQVSYVRMINPAKGERLRSMLQQISWD